MFPTHVFIHVINLILVHFFFPGKVTLPAGTSKRPAVATSTWVPGPGSYAPKMAADKNAPGYTMASNIRSQVAPGADPDEPGPGFYKVNGKEIQDLVRTRAASAEFGKDTNRSSFMTVLPFPGPGAYDQRIPQSQKVSPKFVFGQMDRSKNPKARFSTKMYISSLHTADLLSCGTPGPGAYAHHTAGSGTHPRAAVQTHSCTHTA